MWDIFGDVRKRRMRSKEKTRQEVGMAVPYSLRRYKESLGMFFRGRTTIHMGDTHACVVNLREREKMWRYRRNV